MKDNHELAMERFAAQQTWMDKTGGFAKDMTLRDHYAGLAMQGLIASPRGTPDNSDATDVYYAKCAYLVADAMLKERAK